MAMGSRREGSSNAVTLPRPDADGARASGHSVRRAPPVVPVRGRRRPGPAGGGADARRVGRPGERVAGELGRSSRPCARGREAGRCGHDHHRRGSGADRCLGGRRRPHGARAGSVPGGGSRGGRRSRTRSVIRSGVGHRCRAAGTGTGAGRPVAAGFADAGQRSARLATGCLSSTPHPRTRDRRQRHRRRSRPRWSGSGRRT